VFYLFTAQDSPALPAMMGYNSLSVADSQEDDLPLYDNNLSQTQQQYTQTQQQSQSQRQSSEELLWGILQPVEVESGLLRVELQKAKPEYTIGRGVDSDIVVPDKKVSNLHCRIWIDEVEVVRIEDLSTNGQ
jgi:pSer/pThr/pTyr-binding forkhead associated (FHA) protein